MSETTEEFALGELFEWMTKAADNNPCCESCANSWRWRLRAVRGLQKALDAALARAETTERERDEERSAHTIIATMCFVAGATSADGTSASAVQDLCNQLAALTAERDALAKASRSFIAWMESESRGPDFTPYTRKTHPNPDEASRTWFWGNVELLRVAEEQAREALTPTPEAPRA